MDKITTKSIRNVALLGHGGSGKTSLCEAMLYLAKETDRLGRTPEGNTVSDYDPEEIRRGFSLSTTVEPLKWQDSKINILDTPGYLDFTGEVLEGMRVADSALIVVDGRNGVEVGTELAWDMAEKEGIPKAFFINRFDDGEARFKRVFDALREKFGVTVCPLLIPMIDGDKVIGFLNLIDMKAEVYDKTGANMVSEIPEDFKAIAEEYRNMLYESIAQTSDDLMDKFFNEEPITYNEAMNAVHDGIINGEIVPVFCGSATKMWGVTAVLDTIAN
ncbi:MAG: GTP-binding protein, partial [Clostridia bacterium]|nr:GTP-binding protein [Clostridia bacterium]